MTEKADKKGFDFDPIDLSTLFPGGSVPEPEQAPPAPAADPSVNLPMEPLGEDEKVDEIIDALFLQMKKKGDFPSFSRQISNVNAILNMEYSSVKDIADVIMRDFSLTNRLLKLVNSSFYGHFNKNGVSSVTNAMVIMGTNQIQQAAASLMLFEHMQSNAHTLELKEMAVHTFMSGMMAKDLARLADVRDSEEFQVCAMFHNLGETLIAFYFPVKYKRILDIEARHGTPREEAAGKMLGITFRELGIGIARKWNIPENVIRSMAFDPGNSQMMSGRELSRGDYLGAISSFCNLLCAIQLKADPAERQRAIEELLERFKGVVDLNDGELEGVLKRVSEKIKTHASQLNIDTSKTRFITNRDNDPKMGKPDDKERENREIVLRKKIDGEIVRIDGRLKESFEISEILSDILNVMNREFDYDRVAICIRDTATNNMTVRFGKGKDIDAFSRDFYFPITKSQDIFHLCLAREKDYSIHDIDDSKFKALVPSWYRLLDLAKGFELYAIVINHIALGFFYADWETIREYSPFEQEKGMKKLRSLAEKAIRIKKG
jgi:HD-like signal output (HDOD) protein